VNPHLFEKKKGARGGRGGRGTKKKGEGEKFPCLWRKMRGVEEKGQFSPAVRKEGSLPGKSTGEGVYLAPSKNGPSPLPLTAKGGKFFFVKGREKDILLSKKRVMSLWFREKKKEGLRSSGEKKKGTGARGPFFSR